MERTDVIGIIPALAGAAGVFIFILPVFTGRILNIGNMTGFCVSLCLLVYGIRQDRIHAVIAQGWRRGGLCRSAIAVGGILLTAAAITVLFLTLMIVRAALTMPDPEADVVVLGCEVKGDRPSRMLTGRMDAAIEYLQVHPGLFCVLSGGRGDNEEISEAECMYRYMTARGIDPGRLILEDRSVSTRENLRFSMQKLRESGRADASDADDQAPLQIAVVTNEFHACRARLIAKQLGMRAGTVAAPSPWWLLPTFYVRELYGLLYQIFL